LSGGSPIEDSAHKLKNIGHLHDRLKLHVASLDNVLSLIKTVREVMPDECYHLARIPVSSVIPLR